MKLIDIYGNSAFVSTNTNHEVGRAKFTKDIMPTMDSTRKVDTSIITVSSIKVYEDSKVFDLSSISKVFAEIGQQ